jgi:hypothetical protein
MGGRKGGNGEVRQEDRRQEDRRQEDRRQEDRRQEDRRQEDRRQEDRRQEDRGWLLCSSCFSVWENVGSGERSAERRDCLAL